MQSVVFSVFGFVNGYKKINHNEHDKQKQDFYVVPVVSSWFTS